MDIFTTSAIVLQFCLKSIQTEGSFAHVLNFTDSGIDTKILKSRTIYWIIKMTYIYIYILNYILFAEKKN